MTGRTTKIEKGQPRITPAAATETARAYFLRRNSADERVTAYMEKVLGRKPEIHKTVKIREAGNLEKKN